MPDTAVCVDFSRCLRPNTMSTAIKPILQSILVADRVYTDKDSGKKIIAGVFQQVLHLEALSFEDAQQHEPFRRNGVSAGSPFAYLSLTDVDGEQKFELRYVRLADEEVLFSAEIGVRSPDRLQTVEVSLPLPMLPTKPVGTYALEVLWNSEPLGSYRVLVNKFELKQ